MKSIKIMTVMVLIIIPFFAKGQDLGNDKYNLAVTSACSFVLPGAGHLYVGEPVKALPHLAGSVAVYAAMCAGAYNMSAGSNHKDLGAAMFFGGLALHVTNMIIANKSARSIAKRKNQRYREGLSMLNVSVLPNIQCVQTAQSFTPAAGFSAIFSF